MRATTKSSQALATAEDNTADQIKMKMPKTRNSRNQSTSLFGVVPKANDVQRGEGIRQVLAVRLWPIAEMTLGGLGVVY